MEGSGAPDMLSMPSVEKNLQDLAPTPTRWELRDTPPACATCHVCIRRRLCHQGLPCLYCRHADAICHTIFVDVMVVISAVEAPTVRGRLQLQALKPPYAFFSCSGVVCN